MKKKRPWFERELGGLYGRVETEGKNGEMMHLYYNLKQIVKEKSS